MNREGREAAQAVAVAVEPQELTKNIPSWYVVKQSRLTVTQE